MITIFPQYRFSQLPVPVSTQKVGKPVLGEKSEFHKAQRNQYPSHFPTKYPLGELLSRFWL